MFGDLTENNKKLSLVKLDTLCKIQGGLQVSAETRKNLSLTMPYLRVANVYRNQLELSEIKNIDLTEGELERTRLQKDDILIVEGHGNRNEIGRAAIWDGSIDPVVHQNHLIRVRPDFEQATSIFLCYFVNSESGRQQLIGSSNTTSGLNTISTGKVKNLNLPIPPLSQQHQFAKIIEQIESQKEQAKKSLAESEALFQGLLAGYFGDN
ncbi:restriction endonuclease subunit S [Dyadobacter sp. NIV53]|uniref:restriction endonuclease subunit S n=1 Tax=Dyadobacter sp. NIV53 TaxID=2861765 RepID=UPI001C86CAAA|nr:restriction endonuclease subunit S [Dyadobacter sp. NIV53]